VSSRQRKTKATAFNSYCFYYQNATLARAPDGWLAGLDWLGCGPLADSPFFLFMILFFLLSSLEFLFEF
jgi:hypothetical protein